MKAKGLAKKLDVPVGFVYAYAVEFEELGYKFKKTAGGCKLYGAEDVKVFKRFLSLLGKGYPVSESIRMAIKGIDSCVEKVWSIAEIAEDLGMKRPNVVRYFGYLGDLGYRFKRYEDGRYMLLEADKQLLERMIELHIRGYKYKEGAEIVIGVSRDLSFTKEELVKRTGFDLQTVQKCLQDVEKGWGRKRCRWKGKYYIFTEKGFNQFVRMLEEVYKIAS